MHAGSLAHAASTAAAQQTAQRVVVPRKLPDRQTSNYSAGRQPTRRDTTVPSQQPALGGYDLVLSSGFLAFANHAGFLAAVEEVGLPVRSVMGTSAGALTGSLYCAGHSPTAVAEILSATAPINRLRPCGAPWAVRGLLSMEAVVEELQGLLPQRFEELQRPLGVGVACASTGRHVLVDRGSLAEAVAASAAIPVIFAPVAVPGLQGGPFMDGGVHCRIGLHLWRQHKYGGSPAAAPPSLVHLISRSSPFSGNDDTTDFGRQNAVVLHAPKSGKSFWSLGDFAAEFEESKRRAAPMLRQLWECQQEQQQRQQQLQQQGWAAEDDEQQWQQPRPTIVL